MEETKVIYYVDEEETPYLMKIGQSPGKVTLADFKGQLNRPYHKFFFKSVDDDFGWDSPYIPLSVIWLYSIDRLYAFEYLMECTRSSEVKHANTVITNWHTHTHTLTHIHMHPSAQM